ncbi:MAG: tetratricopeptide repeat protein [Flavobacteriales bacterium]
MKNRLCAMVLLGCCLTARGTTPDSLKSVLVKKNLPDSSRFFTLLETAEYYYNSEGVLDTSLVYYQRSLRLAKKIGRNDMLADAHSGLGLIYREKGLFDKALSNYLAALKYSQKTNTVRRIARDFNGIAVVHAIQSNTDKALEYYKKSEEICLKHDYKPGLASVYNNMGLTYVDKGDHQKALEYYTKGIAINKENNNMRGVATVNENIGLIYLQFLNDPSKAINHFKESIAIWRGMNDRNSVSITLQYISMALTANGQYKMSIDSSRASLKLAREVGSLSSEREVYFQLQQAYEKLGDVANAFKFYKRWNSLSDSLKNDDELREITSMQVAFEMNQQQAIDSLQTEVQHQFEISKQKSRNNWLLGGLGIVALFSGFLYVAFVRNKKARKQIAGQKLTIEQRNREVMDSIRYASRIQNAILPPDEKMKKLLHDHFVFYQPKDIVSGDFYWVEEKKGLVFMAVVDCTGHGVPGAFMSIMGRNGLHEAVNIKELYRANEILDFLNEYVKEAIHHQSSDKMRINDGMDISLCVWNTKTNQLEFAGANNSLWIFRSSGNSALCSVIEIPADKKPIGSHDLAFQQLFSLHQVEVVKGDLICMFSDGYADQFGGPKGKKIKYNRLKQLFQEKAQAGTLAVSNELCSFFYTWKGDLEQIDDVCIVGVRI